MPTEGTSLHFDHTVPPSSVYAANAVVGAGIEFSYASYFSVDVTERDIKFISSTSGSFNSAAFNGLIITDYLDTLPDFTAISLVADGAGGAIDPSRYWVEADAVHLNFQNLSLDDLNGITFRIVLGDLPTNIGLSNHAVVEGVSGAVIGDLVTADVDQPAGHIYTVDDPRFEVVAGQLKLKNGIALDYDSDPVVPITVTTTDEWDNEFEQILTITVGQDNPPPPPGNHRPTILSPVLQDAVEGDKTAFTVQARDSDGDPLTYSISGGKDANAFVIDPVTGELTFTHVPDFERPGSAAGTNSYLVEVSVSDEKVTVAKTFEIDVNDVDEVRVDGTFGDDQFSASDSPTHFIGLDGLDVVTFPGPASDYAIETGPHGTLYVTHPSGTDTLESVERLQFEDGTLAFDFDGTAGQVYRLYQAAFNRAPDAEGLGFWLENLDGGTLGLEAISDFFVASSEFIGLYGDSDSVSDAGYVGLLYQNALGRPFDAEGFAFWLDRLGSGEVDRGDALASFSESPESIAGVGPVIGDGIWFV